MSASPVRPGVVLVTGATAGIGLATVRRFADLGARVVAVARRRERLDALAADMGSSLVPLVMDVADAGSIERGLASLPTDVSEIDVLVNNAGLALGTTPADRSSLDDWAQMIDTNCKGLAFLTRAVLPGMVARDRGHVVNLGSTAGHFPYPGGNVYGATKAFVEQFSLNLRADLIGTAVRVTEVRPGLTGGTEFSNVRFKGDGDKASAVYAGTTPLEPGDIADAIVYVTSLPYRVNVNSIEIMPVRQAPGPISVDRDGVKGFRG